MIVLFMILLLAPEPATANAAEPPLMNAMEPAMAPATDPATDPATTTTEPTTTTTEPTTSATEPATSEAEPATAATTTVATTTVATTTAATADSATMPASKSATTSLASTAPTTAESRRSYDSSNTGQRRYSRYRSERNSRDSSQAPINPPSTNPATIDPLNPRPMSPEFAVLLSRSMFVRGHISVDTHRSGGAVPLQNNSPSPSTEPNLARPESTLVFNGVTVANGNSVAFIEDTANQRVLTVQVGQQIAQGKITDITLDTLAYRNSSRTVVLHIGQDLSGNDATVAPASPTTTPGDLPSTGNSALDRLRKKRLQELLGK